MDETKTKKPSKVSFLLGLVVLLFAVIGLVLMIYHSVLYIKSTYASEGEFAQYNSFLIPVAAVDADPFDDITAADSEQLLNASVWLILSKATTPDTYPYQSGYMLIPQKDVEQAYMSMFGPETAAGITHGDINAYNCTFLYDSTEKVYKIPVTAITPVYTPRVTDVKKSGTSLVVTAEYIAAERAITDSEGNIMLPEPDKVMKITLRELQGSYYISAVQTISFTIPETVSYEATTAAESDAQTTETTTQKEAEKTTLGGKVPN